MQIIQCSYLNLFIFHVHFTPTDYNILYTFICLIKCIGTVNNVTWFGIVSIYFCILKLFFWRYFIVIFINFDRNIQKKYKTKQCGRFFINTNIVRKINYFVDGFKNCRPDDISSSLYKKKKNMSFEQWNSDNISTRRVHEKKMFRRR